MRLYPDDERGATSPLSKAEFAKLVAANPNATDEEILQQAVGGSSLASKIFEQPILPELEIENPLGQGAYNVLRNIVVGSPADLALNVATLGAATAPRIGLKAAAPALRAASGALSGAVGARGISHALDSDLDPTSRTFGVIQGLLGGAGAAAELRALSRAGKAAPRALPRPESIPADISRPELGTVARRVRQMEGTSDPQFHMIEDEAPRIGAGPTTALSIAGPVASQFISEEDDPNGIIRTGLNLMGLGGLGAAAYWQMKPATKLSTLAAGQAATGKSFDEFKALAPTYVPEGFTEKQLERAWAFGVQKADELHTAHPRAFDEDYWSALYDKDPSFKDWWADAIDVANEVAPENPELFALFLSTTSAQAPPKLNLQRALQAWDAYKKGAPFPRELGRSINQNLDRAVAEGRIGGRKTSSMFETIMGREHEGPMLPRAVLDRHMAKLSGFGSGRKKDTVLNDPEYEVLERILTRVAEKKGIRLSQLQAGLWKHGMDLSGEQALASRGRVWEKPDVSYPFGQLKKLIEAEGRLKPSVLKNFAKAAKHLATQTVMTPAKGATVDPRTGKSLAGSKGFAVSLFPERSLQVPVAHLTDATVLGFIKDNADLLENPNLMIGSWDNGNGSVWLDIVAVVKDRHHAEWLGKRYNQMGVADLSLTGEGLPFPDDAFISTGGTGSGLPEGIPSIYDRLGDLETIDIEHYTRKPGVSVLDPEFYGTGMAGEERRRKDLPDWVNRVYAYVAGTRPEARFRGAGKITGRIPKRSIYDLVEDPLKLREQIDLSRPEGLNALEKAVMEAGFLGMEFPSYPGWLQLFQKIYMDAPDLVAAQMGGR